MSRLDESATEVEGGKRQHTPEPEDKALEPYTKATDPEDKAVDTATEATTLISGLPLVVIMTGLALAGFVVALDTSIIATAIPFITEEFHSTQDIGWYGSAYFLTLCSLQPVNGKLYSSFSLKSHSRNLQWSFITFFAVFELGSLLCAVAVNSNMFIGGRAVAGLGGSGILLGALSIIAYIIPLNKRPLYTGLFVSVFSIALVVGPIIGGAFTQHVTWRWCFYINLPIGCATFLALGFLFHPLPRPQEGETLPQRIKKLDLVGAVLFTPAVLMALLALQWGGSTYPWHSATIIGLFVGFGALMGVFVLWEAFVGDEIAMLPSSLLRLRAVAFAGSTQLFATGGIFAAVYYLPEWFQVVRGASPVRSGVMNIPSFLSQVLASILAGGLGSKIGGLNPWIWVGCALMAVGTGLYSTLTVDSDAGHWIGFQILQGFGFGCVAQMPTIAVQMAVPPQRVPIALAMTAFAQFFGSAIFVAIAQTIFSNVLIAKLATDAPDVDAEALLLAGSGAVRSIVPPESLSAVLAAYESAITSTFYLTAATSVTAFFVSFGIPWTSVKAKKQTAGL
ncbi:hypothetical protein THAR02_01214 [Trichoderma harzianum]|uniref:Major facilitator superfamily (MFS) profile domain-containing protein n=1 Tax=Trichoderma harzianum TaxID=5544 RepID=A0A0F9XQH2_TRIHA|nr:hypothetical protein THAR02_01214 [Trichoderma harzianum]